MMATTLVWFLSYSTFHILVLETNQTITIFKDKSRILPLHLIVESALFAIDNSDLPNYNPPVKKKRPPATLFNPHRAGRPAIHDRGIRHISRDPIKKLTALHLTIKIIREKAGLKNKAMLKVLQRAIVKARSKGLAVVHYTLEFDHIHLLVESGNHQELGKAMQSLGVSLSMAINRLRGLQGKVFKTRYHLRKLKTPTEIRNVIKYILGNTVKHRATKTPLSIYNSFIALSGMKNLAKSLVQEFEFLHEILVTEILSPPQGFLVKQQLALA
jgi:REP element-mobilizing transposase RayT